MPIWDEAPENVPSISPTIPVAVELVGLVILASRTVPLPTAPVINTIPLLILSAGIAPETASPILTILLFEAS